MNDAYDIEAEAASWLIEQEEAETWSAEEQARLDAWLTEDTAHLLAYWRLEAGWSRAELASDLHRFQGVRPGRPSRRKLWVSFVGAAAVLVGLAFVGIAQTGYFRSSHQMTFATEVGGRKTIGLSDGTQIELNTNTMLSVRMDDTGRYATLERGEAFFNVRHDAARPFVVTVAGHRITDLGTKFLVREEPGRIKIALIEGRARLDSVGGNRQQRSVVMAPGDEVAATRDGIAIAHKPEKQLNNELSWRHGVLVFDDTSLVEVAREFNRYNDLKIVIGDDAAKRLKISGTMPSNDTDELIRMAQNFFGLHLERRRNEIVLSRR